MHDADPKDATSFEIVVWLLQIGRGHTDRAELLGLIEKNHMQREELAAQCNMLARDEEPLAREIVERSMKDSPHAAVRGHATFALAQAALRDADAAQRMRDEKDEEKLARLRKFTPADQLAKLDSMDIPAVRKDAEAMLERVANEYADVSAGKRTLGEQASNQLFEMRHLVVGKPAPDIEAEDLAGTPFKLSDYRGKVVLLDFWGHW
jgi:hypothetical protein